ncbi:hypothetical protein DPMN_005099 [Dreissena polymorpha]|uniref:Uncharacterized protein n=2 Tax=Dreissena polymorpha TaxID=45954 RepID=A0A9D4RTK6_DREPO|nr:hypothetical protein DPMN_005099 [Dreissena polymorpha]
MSETEPVLEPIPVTKDLPVVNGKENYDIHDLKSEYANGLQESDMDHENKTGLNGDIDSDEVEVNGDNEAEHRVNGGMEDEDSIGGDELPPPPELVPELPPPPAETGVEEREGEAEETDEVPAELINDEPVDETAMDEVIESSVDPEVVDDQCMDDNDELMNVSDNDEANARQSLEPPQRLTDYLSEEELVSDGGLEDEHEKPTEQECEETQEQLIDFGETKHESDADEPGLEPEVEETVHQEDPVPGDEPVEVVHEAPVVEEPTSDTEEPTEAKQQHMSYSEPAIVIDNKPAEEDEEETPPPPPPPLVNETPPPPPPLDDSVPLKRVSGGSTPSKESNQSLESPTPPSQSVAVVPPQPEIKPVVKPSPELERKEPEQEPKAAPPAQPAPSAQPVAIVTQPVAIVIPQVKSDEEASPPGSPSTSSSADRPETEQPDQLSSPQVSQKINKKNFKNKIKFGMDLVEGSLKHLHFLKTVNNNPGLYEEWLFKKAIRRYEAFWLPLAAEHKKECLAAPLDIEWIWHCHMLSPVTYEKDCKTQVRLLVEHKVMSEKDRTKALEKSRKYWTAKYPKEPFEIELVYKESVIKEEIPVALGDEVVAEKKADGETEEVKTEEKTEETVEKDNNVAVAEAKAGQTDKSLTDGADQPSTSEQAPAVTEQPEPEQAMEAKLTKEPSEPKIPEEGYEQRSSYHIFAAICRQRVFYYQTSLAHYHDKTFLKAAQKRYQRFLFLKHQNPSEMLVPCYDIDLMWHTHMLQPSAYKHDTTKVLGQTLVHDDSVNNRAAGSALVRADNRTRDLWKELFNDSFTSFGGMFRGDPPILCERMSLIEPVETYTFSTKKATINLDKVQIEGLPEEVNKYSVKLAIGTNERDGPVIKQLKGNKKKIEFENTKKGLAHFLFDTKEYDRIKFNMTSQVGFACTGHDEDIGQQMFHLMPVVEGIPMNQSEPSNLTDTVTIDYEHNLKATFTASIEPPKQGPTMLFLVPGNYETRFCIMPEQVVQMWGPVPLPRLPAGADNHCIIASHK